MKFEQALPRLVSAYRRSELVPFIGSGMSLPACATWKQLVHNLEREAVTQPTGAVSAKTNSHARRNAAKGGAGTDLIHRVERAVDVLTKQGPTAFADACRIAVVSNPRAQKKVPDQNQALAKIYWPLVLTTNYDDWYS